MRTILPFMAACALATACAGGGGEPAPLTGTLSPTALAGRAVLVFPVQRAPSREDATRELVFALEGRGGSQGWTFPDALRDQLRRSPQLDVPVDALPVGIFLQAEVRRIGDPLYGMLRRAASLNGTTVALIPVAVGFRPGTAEAPAAMELVAALIDVTSGRVVWVGQESAPASSPDDPGGLARVMDTLAGRLLPAG